MQVGVGRIRRDVQHYWPELGVCSISSRKSARSEELTSELWVIPSRLEALSEDSLPPKRESTYEDLFRKYVNVNRW